MTALPPKFTITAEDIDRTITRFYAAVRAHDVLGPIFAAHVADWPTHEEKIGRFWRNAILYERSYDGNPMRVHLGTPEIKAEHFALWLGLFDEILAQTLEPEAAQSWSALAHRIGRGMRLGIEDRDRVSDAPPKLF